MQVTLHYIFVPTPALLEAATDASGPALHDVESSVWLDVEHSRVGAEFKQREVESAFWAIFLANLVYEPPEAKHLLQFRERCQQLGFSGCWAVHVTRSGGSAEELVAEAEQARQFLAARGVPSELK